MAPSLLPTLAMLADPAKRPAAAEALASRLGVASLLLFVRDPELHTLLPPVGVAQTIAGGPRWRAFLKSCAAPGRYEALVDCPRDQERVAVAIVAEGVAVVMFGEPADEGALAELCAALPLVAAIFSSEHARRLAEGAAAVARTTGRRAHDLALALDAARGDVERALAESARLNAELQADTQRKDEFLAMLSHELRNPMAAIGAALQVLRLGERSESARALDILERQATQLTRLVDDLLDVARVTRGKISLRLTVVDVSSVLRRAIESTASFASERRHVVEPPDAPEPVYAQVDVARLEQMITNLLTNAIRYTEPGGRIRASVRREGAHAVIRVEDTGIGISDSMLRSIFDPFVQVAASIDRGTGGLGIGLTLVRELAQLHGGSIEAESTVGVGSVFTLRLRVAEPPTADVSTTTAVPVRATKRRVLVVDDNADSREMIAMLLESWGHEGLQAGDGPSAVAIATDSRPDVVLLDIGLPGMNGYEVAARLRQSDTTRHALILAVSGYGHEEDRRRSREAGCDGHLVKPVDLHVLRRAIEADQADRS